MNDETRWKEMYYEMTYKRDELEAQLSAQAEAIEAAREALSTARIALKLRKDATNGETFSLLLIEDALAALAKLEAK